MKIVKNIIKIVVITLLTLIFLYNIYNYINTKILKNSITEIGGYAILEVVSGSMEPTIKIGDIIIIDTKNKDYKKDDIVTFTDVNNAFVTHRIIEINNNKMITKGDANDSNDDATETSKIIGRYVYKLTGLGAIIASFRSPITLTIILIMGIIICYLMSTDIEGNPIDMVKELVIPKDRRRKRTNKGKRKEKREKNK